MKPVPLRHFIAVGIALACSGLAFFNHYAEIAQQNAGSADMIGAPPPPFGVFPQTILVFPGLLSGLPLIITGAALESQLILECGQIFGAIFFWYSVGWWIDCLRGSVTQDTPPRFVLIHLRALRVISVALFPLALIEGMKVGDYFCANGKPPFLSELLIYGIGMVWIAVGASFAWRNFRESRRDSILSLTFPGS